MSSRLPPLGVAERQFTLRCARIELDEPGAVGIEAHLARPLAWHRLSRHRLAEDWLLLVYVAHVGRSLWRCAGGVLAHAYWTACQWTRARTGLAGGHLSDRPRP